MKDKGVVRSFLMITQIGISVLVPVFLCIFLGRWLDGVFGTSFLTSIFLLLGIAAAFRNVYLMTRTFYAKDKAKEDAYLSYIKSLKENKEVKEYLPPKTETDVRKREMEEEFERFKRKRERKNSQE